MKILHLIDSGGLYGAEVMLLNLVEEQRKLGHYPVIASIGQKGIYVKPLEAEARKRRLEVVIFRMMNGPNILGALNLLRYARKNRFDILHSHGYKCDILLGFIPCSLRGIPLVSTIHGWTNANRFSKLGLYEYADALSLKHADAVCVVNQVMCGHPRLKSLQEKIHVITNGIPTLDTDEPVPEDETAEFCRKGFTVVTIGRLSREKGHEYLIRAFDKFQKVTGEGRLLIIGEGPEQQVLEDQIQELGLKGKVLLAGYRDSAWRYLSLCKVFILPSLTEGLPITLLEAMQVGVPVIASAVGGIPQLITNGKNGLLVPPRDTDIIFQSIHKIYLDDGFSEVAAVNNKELVTNLYSSRRMARDYDFVYKYAVN
ncbi:MAG TPA: glycosyltransferase [Bacteroidales bacterium]|nr:glycosyltransferase [Bacteroidales bacterium]